MQLAELFPRKFDGAISISSPVFSPQWTADYLGDAASLFAAVLPPIASLDSFTSPWDSANLLPGMGRVCVVEFFCFCCCC